MYSAREDVSSFGAAARRLRQRVPLRSGLAASERAVMRVALDLSASFLLTFVTAPALAADPSVSAGDVTPRDKRCSDAPMDQGRAARAGAGGSAVPKAAFGVVVHSRIFLPQYIRM